MSTNRHTYTIHLALSDNGLFIHKLSCSLGNDLGFYGLSKSSAVLQVQEGRKFIAQLWVIGLTPCHPGPLYLTPCPIIQMSHTSHIKQSIRHAAQLASKNAHISGAAEVIIYSPAHDAGGAGGEGGLRALTVLVP